MFQKELEQKYTRPSKGGSKSGKILKHHLR